MQQVQRFREQDLFSINITAEMRSMSLLRESGDMPPPGKFRKITLLRLSLEAILSKNH